MKGYSEDRTQPLWMEHTYRDYGYDLTQTEFDAELSEERPSRTTTALRAAGMQARQGLDRNCRPTSDPRPGGSSHQSPRANTSKGES